MFSEFRAQGTSINYCSRAFSPLPENSGRRIQRRPFRLPERLRSAFSSYPRFFPNNQNVKTSAIPRTADSQLTGTRGDWERPDKPPWHSRATGKTLKQLARKHPRFFLRSAGVLVNWEFAATVSQTAFQPGGIMGQSSGASCILSRTCRYSFGDAPVQHGVLLLPFPSSCCLDHGFDGQSSA